MGCKEWKSRTFKKTVDSSKSVILLWFLLAIFACLLCSGGTWTSTVNATMYIPAAPQGPQHGFINIEYPYEIITMNLNASWLFDWGDGTTSDWLRLPNATTSILQTHLWTSAGVYSVRVLYRSDSSHTGLWSESLSVSISTVTTADYPLTPVLISGPVEGMNSTNYTFAVQGTNLHGYRLQFRCDWGDLNVSTWSALVPTGSTVTFVHCWNAPGNYFVRFQARDEYGLESSWSAPTLVVIQAAAESNQSVKNLVRINGVVGFVTYQSDHTGVFLNTTSGVLTHIAWHGEGTYYLDDDNDGLWEYSYNPAQGVIEPFAAPVSTTTPTQFQVPWLFIYIIIGVIAGVAAIVVILVKTGYLYVYEETVNKE